MFKKPYISKDSLKILGGSFFNIGVALYGINIGKKNNDIFNRLPTDQKKYLASKCSLNHIGSSMNPVASVEERMLKNDPDILNKKDVNPQYANPSVEKLFKK